MKQATCRLPKVCQIKQNGYVPDAGFPLIAPSLSMVRRVAKLRLRQLLVRLVRLRRLLLYYRLCHYILRLYRCSKKKKTKTSRVGLKRNCLKMRNAWAWLKSVQH